MITFDHEKAFVNFGIGSLIYFSILEVYAAERIYGGPTSIEEAKEKFFKNRKLDIIEGIWYQEDEAAMYAVVKISHGVYDVWTVEHKISK